MTFAFLKYGPTFVKDRLSHIARVILLIHLIYFLIFILKDIFYKKKILPLMIIFPQDLLTSLRIQMCIAGL